MVDGRNGGRESPARATARTVQRATCVPPAVWAALGVALILAPAAADEAPPESGPLTGSVRGDGIAELPPQVAAGFRRTRAPDARRDLPALDERTLPAGETQERIGVVRAFDRIRASVSPSRLAAESGSALHANAVLWSAEVSAPGATALRVRVEDCDLPRGATLWFVNADDPAEIYGPFTGRGPRGDGAFYSPSVFGSRVRTEIRGQAESAPHLAIPSVVHTYRDAAPAAARLLSCHRGVECESSFATAAKGIAHLSFVSGGSQYICSGSILSDLDETTQKAWLLTANHCISTEGEASSLEAYFDFHPSSCGGVAPALSSVPRALGATLVASQNDASTDCTLLRVTGTMPLGRTYLGWSSGGTAPSATVRGLHHPEGAPMKVAFGGVAAIGPVDTVGSDYITVRWTDGTTEGGSSGSPLLTTGLQVIGQLWGGYESPDCAAGQFNESYYGDFAKSYTDLALDKILAVNPATAADACDPLDNPQAGATALVAQSETGATHGPHTLSSSDTADWFSVSLAAGTEYQFFAEGGGDTFARLYREGSPTQVAADDNTAGNRHFLITHRATVSGRYLLEVVRGGGAANAGYTLHFAVVPPPSTLTWYMFRSSSNLVDKYRPDRDTIDLKGQLVFTTRSPDGKLDFAAEGFTLRLGSENAPVLVTVPPGKGWKSPRGKPWLSTWSGKTSAGAKVSFSLNAVTGAVVVKVRNIDFAKLGAVPARDLRLRIEVGNDSAEHGGVWTQTPVAGGVRYRW